MHRVSLWARFMPPGQDALRLPPCAVGLKPELWRPLCGARESHHHPSQVGSAESLGLVPWPAHPTVGMQRGSGVGEILPCAVLQECPPSMGLLLGSGIASSSGSGCCAWPCLGRPGFVIAMVPKEHSRWWAKELLFCLF